MPFVDQPEVRAVDLERVREEFDKVCPLDPGDRKKSQATRRQRFRRSREEAQTRGLIGGRELEGTFMVWITPAGEGNSPLGSHG